MNFASVAPKEEERMEERGNDLQHRLYPSSDLLDPQAWAQ
jgi:hypothetical protein